VLRPRLLAWNRAPAHGMRDEYTKLKECGILRYLIAEVNPRILEDSKKHLEITRGLFGIKA